MGIAPCAASIPVVGFNAILMSEHFGAFFAFAVLHAALAIRYIKVQPLSLAARHKSCSTLLSLPQVPASHPCCSLSISKDAFGILTSLLRHGCALCSPHFGVLL